MTSRRLLAILAVLVLFPIALWFAVDAGDAGDAAIGEAKAGVRTSGSARPAHVLSEDSDAEGAALSAIQTLSEEARREDAPYESGDWPPVIEGPEDLGRLVAWMRGLSEGELLRLSNAEFNFKGSPLVDLFHELEGEWVVSTLGELAIAEGETLLKSILVEGLCGAVSFERYDDEEMIPILSTLLVEFSVDELDPYGVGVDVIDSSFSACLRQGTDYSGFAETFLANSDNRQMLISGYSFMGGFPGSENILAEAMANHPNAAGRMGAITGLGFAVSRGFMEPDEATRLGLLALEDEADERCRDRIFVMLGADGGPEGQRVLEEMVASLDPEHIGQAAKSLATTGDPATTLLLIEQALGSEQLDESARADLYIALGVLPDGTGALRLLDVIGNDELSATERAAGLKGLWNAELSEDVARGLEDLVLAEGDAELRAEALRILTAGEGGSSNIDLRELASLDGDPEVRSEAIIQASLEPKADNREWLEERLASDSSLDVRATALGALVMHAHYAGGGDAALVYLNRADSMTKDPEVRKMIQRGRDMVSGFDPRAIELGLAEDARVYGTIASLTEGSTSRNFARQSQQLYKMVAALRAGRQ